MANVLLNFVGHINRFVLSLICYFAYTFSANVFSSPHLTIKVMISYRSFSFSSASPFQSHLFRKFLPMQPYPTRRKWFVFSLILQMFYSTEVGQIFFSSFLSFYPPSSQFCPDYVPLKFLVTLSLLLFFKLDSSYLWLKMINITVIWAYSSRRYFVSFVKPRAI